MPEFVQSSIVYQEHGMHLLKCGYVDAIKLSTLKLGQIRFVVNFSILYYFTNVWPFWNHRLRVICLRIKWFQCYYIAIPLSDADAMLKPIFAHIIKTLLCSKYVRFSNLRSIGFHLQYHTCMGPTVLNIRYTRNQALRKLFFDWCWIQSLVHWTQVRTKLRMNQVLIQFYPRSGFVCIIRNVCRGSKRRKSMREMENAMSGNNNRHICTFVSFQNLFNFILFQFTLFSIRFRRRAIVFVRICGAEVPLIHIEHSFFFVFLFFFKSFLILFVVIERKTIFHQLDYSI